METFKYIPAGNQDVSVENNPDGTTVVLDTAGQPLIRFTPKPLPSELPADEMQALASKMQQAMIAKLENDLVNSLTNTVDAEFHPEPHHHAEWKQPCKASHEVSKKRRKMAKQSRKINRRK